MKKLLLLIGLFALVSLPAFAQYSSYPRRTVFDPTDLCAFSFTNTLGAKITFTMQVQQEAAQFQVLATNVYEFVLSDETTDLTTGTKFVWRTPFPMTIKDVRASVTTASSSGLPTVDIKESGTTVFSTKLTIDATEKTSTTAATSYVLSDSSLADDAEMTFNVDVSGTGTTGLKVKIYYTRQ